jgi:NhaP-type Na+/H+ or K+/H+ antiporter
VFALLVLEEGGVTHEDLILTTAFVTVGLSVLAHGVTAAPLAKRYADWHDARVAETPVESGHEEELRWRLQAE